MKQCSGDGGEEMVVVVGGRDYERALRGTKYGVVSD